MTKLKPHITLFSCVCAVLLAGAWNDNLAVAAGTDTQNVDKTASPPVKPALLKQAHVLYSPDKRPPVGSVITSVDTMEMKNSKLNITMGEQKMDGVSNMTGFKKDTTTVVDANSIEVSYVEDKLQQNMTIKGQLQKQPDKIGKLVGKTIAFKKENGKWSGMFKGGNATEEQKKKLAKKVKNLNDPSDLHTLGTKPRKVGDTWNVDVSKLKSFGDGDEPPKGTFKVTFKTIENYQGHACAVIEADVDITGKGKDGMTMRINGKSTVYRELKYQVTLMNKIVGAMSISGSVKGGAGGIKVEGPTKMIEKKELKLR